MTLADAIFLLVLFIVVVAYLVYYFKVGTVIDPVTGNRVSKKTLKKYLEQRAAGSQEQALYDEGQLANAILKQIGEECPAFHQKYGKAMDIVYHILRLKVLIEAYGDLPNKEELLKSLNYLLPRTYETIYADVNKILEPYFADENELYAKLKLRVELVKHLDNIQKIVYSPNI